MRIVLFFDQLQAGMGGKYDTQVPLGVEKGGIGSYGMFQQYVKEEDATVLATIYCGKDYFMAHKEECLEKIGKLLQKVKADVLICGPCFDFKDYTQMSVELATFIDSHHYAKALVACSKENDALITDYKTKITMVEMPKKGGVGLNQALKNMVHIAKMLVNDDDTTNFPGIY